MRQVHLLSAVIFALTGSASVGDVSNDGEADFAAAAKIERRCGKDKCAKADHGAKALSILQITCDRDDHDGCYNASVLLWEGEIVAKDLPRAAH